MNVLGTALGKLVEDTLSGEDPVLAGGMCVLHRSNICSVASIEAPNTESGALLMLAAALLLALSQQETDARVRERLRAALKAVNEAQVTRVTPDDTTRLN
jgi:hypothetical protein